MSPEEKMVMRFFGYCVVMAGIVAFTKYKIAKLDWANALKMAEKVKETTA